MMRGKRRKVMLARLKAIARGGLARVCRDRSFSIYGEDALVFAGLQPTRKGFYVDVGAHNPVEGSNTYRLYRRGWRGITVEPNPDAEQPFRRWRPRDIHVVEGVSQTAGRLEYFRFQNSVMNTFSVDRANHIQEHGEVMTGSRTIPTRPLRDIIMATSKDVHVDLLTVDCEGLDLDVLQSADLSTARPTVAIVEDLPGYYAFRDGGQPSEIQAFMRAQGYSPVTQAFYSTIFVAHDWKRLLKSNPAFSVSQPSLLPTE